MTLVENRLRPPRTPRLVLAVLVVATVLAPVLLFPYVGLDAARSRIETGGAGVHYALLVVHVTSATVAMFLGALQLVPRVRAHRPVHRAIGRTFLLLGLVAYAGTGLVLTLLSPATTFARIGLMVPVVLWPVLAVLGYRAIRRGDVAAHRAWMVRLYAVTFFAITARVVTPLLMLALLPVAGGGPEQLAEEAVPFGQWLGWIVNLTVAEVALRRTPRTARHPGREAVAH